MSIDPLTLLELVHEAEFQAGVVCGVGGLAVILLSARGPTRIPIWGVVVATAILSALFWVGHSSLFLATGVVLLFVSGELLRRSKTLAFGIMVAGALTLVTLSDIDDEPWIRLGTILFTLVGGWTIVRVDREIGQSGIPILMIASTILGIWGTVPDTEHARLAVGVAAAMLWAGWPLKRASVGRGGSFAIAGLLAWVIATGGEPRSSSIIGGWATIGGFTTALAALRWSPRRQWVFFGLHVVAVLVASRIAGLKESPYLATAIAAPTLVLTAALGRLLIYPVSIRGRSETPPPYGPTPDQ